MKIIQTVAYIGDESSGPSYSVPSLCNALGTNDLELEFYTLAPMPKQPDTFESYSFPRHFFPHPSFGRSPEMFTALKETCKTGDIIHNHALWMAPSIYAERASYGTNCKLVVSPRGSLTEWALKRSRLKKKLSWWCGQKAVLQNADMLHATAESEYLEIRNFGLKQPVVIIPNGINLPNLDLVRDSMRCHNKMRLVFMSRIHPKKNIESLLGAWNKIQKLFTDWELLIVGPDKNNSYADKMKTLSKRLGNERVIFYGEVKGQEKVELLANSNLFVLPTYNENFGMVVAEALACETPVISTKGAPWSGLEKNNAGWWIDIGEVPLAETLKQAMSLSEPELLEMGRNGRKWMKNKFSWEKIGHDMLKAYKWLINGGVRPDFVIVE